MMIQIRSKSVKEILVLVIRKHLVMCCESGEASVKEFSDWKPGCPVGCMFVTVRAVVESQGGGDIFAALLTCQKTRKR